jgi:transposase
MTCSKLYGDESLSHRCVSEWINRLKDGREDLPDNPRSRRPTTTRNGDAIENVCEMVTQDY